MQALSVLSKREAHQGVVLKEKTTAARATTKRPRFRSKRMEKAKGWTCPGMTLMRRGTSPLAFTKARRPAKNKYNHPLQGEHISSRHEKGETPKHERKANKGPSRANLGWICLLFLVANTLWSINTTYPYKTRNGSKQRAQFITRKISRTENNFLPPKRSHGSSGTNSAGLIPKRQEEAKHGGPSRTDLGWLHASFLKVNKHTMSYRARPRGSNLTGHQHRATNGKTLQKTLDTDEPDSLVTERLEVNTTSKSLGSSHLKMSKWYNTQHQDRMVSTTGLQSQLLS
jgi:hypothetical protein